MVEGRLNGVVRDKAARLADEVELTLWMYLTCQTPHMVQTKSQNVEAGVTVLSTVSRATRRRSRGQCNLDAM